MTLHAMQASEDPHPHDAYLMEFANPWTAAGPDDHLCVCKANTTGFTTRPVRSSDGTIHVVVEGAGWIEIDDVRFELAEGESSLCPLGQRRLHADQELVLFSYSDRATTAQALSLAGIAALVTAGREFSSEG